MLFLVLVALTCSHVAAEYFASFDSMLRGRWLIRRHTAGAARGPYTHQLTLAGSGSFDGVVFGELTPYDSNDDLSNSLMSWWYRSTTNSSNTGASYIAWNSTFSVHFSFEGDSEGVLTITEKTKDGVAVPTPQSVTYPLIGHASPSDQHRHRSLSATSPTLTTGLIVSTQEKEKDVVPTVLHSILLHFLDESHAIGTLTFAVEGQVLPADDTRTVVLKRYSTEEEGQSWKSLVGTFGLLIVVAAVKFGPRQYMRWKGISPNDVLRKRGVTVNKKGAGMKQASELLQSLKK